MVFQHGNIGVFLILYYVVVTDNKYNITNTLIC